MERYDVIIIGTGAGGGTLAWQLAPSGLRVLLIERGGFLPREAENWRSRPVFTEGRYKAGEAWLDRKGRTIHPGIHYFVGGNTKVYGAALLRFRERDFGELHHASGTSPAWPIAYEDIEPWYTAAERLYHVHGERGADPTDPPASAPYPHPPARHEPRVAELAQALGRIGLRPFPLPLGLRLDDRDQRESPCIRCGTCDGFPCLVNAKADADVIAVRPALAHPNVTLLTEAFAERIETDASGTEATGVLVRRAGRMEFYRGDVIVVSAGAINSAALLLRSASDRHPRGLANRSGVVGRHYMCHHNSALLAITRDRNPTVFQKTLGINDWYFGDAGFPHPLGHVQMLGKSDGEMLKGDAPRFTPKAVLDGMAAHSLDFWLTSEDLPDPENRVTLEADGRIRLSYTASNLEGHRRLVARLKEALRRAARETGLLKRPVFLHKKIPIEGTAHQCGTVRFGTDPRSSALDPDCRAHDVHNLYVVDGSFFVSSTAVNPALTIIANALRVGGHLRTRLGAGKAALLAAGA
jgi:choline dehydrogenase-like flavoprotein